MSAKTVTGDEGTSREAVLRAMQEAAECVSGKNGVPKGYKGTKGIVIAPRALATSGRRPGVRAKRAARGVAGHHLNNRQARENRTPIHSY